MKLRPDGTFTMRYSFPDGRQIIPAVAASADGIEERTIVLAVERNTKELEPMIHDVNKRVISSKKLPAMKTVPLRDRFLFAMIDQ